MNKGQTAGLTAFFEAMSLPQTSLLGLLKAGCPGNSRQMLKCIKGGWCQVAKKWAVLRVGAERRESIAGLP